MNTNRTTSEPAISSAFEWGVRPLDHYLLHEFNGQTYQVKKLAEKASRVLLGGHVLASCERQDDGIHQNVQLLFHGGRNTWHVQNEMYSEAQALPRNDLYGTLPKMMEAFESITDLVLPTIKITSLGFGVSTYSSKGVEWNPNNPFELIEGKTYQRGVPGKTPVTAIAVGGRIRMRFEREDAVRDEWFDPSQILSELDWIAIREQNEQAWGTLKMNSDQGIAGNPSQGLAEYPSQSPANAHPRP